MTPSNLAFLHDLTLSVIEASRIQPDETLAVSDSDGETRQVGPNASGGPLIRPGGFECYPAFWIRDYTMSLASGLIPVEEQRHTLLYTAHHQCDQTFSCPSGSIVSRGNICDHITFDGFPIFYPGTVDGFEIQGSPFGFKPPLDNQFYFVEMAWFYIAQTGDARILSTKINGRVLWQRLVDAFYCCESCPDTELAVAFDKDPAINFGFFDQVIQSGSLLFASILRWRAARMLASLSPGQSARQGFEKLCKILQTHISSTFRTEIGLLKASTGRSSQPDVWGSAYAVYSGILSPEESNHVSRSLLRLHQGGEISWRGSIRQVPTSEDASENSCWSEVRKASQKNRYQHGAYWGTPTGWIAYALAQHDVLAAEDLLSSYLAELHEGDYRIRKQPGSPWECMHPEGDHKQNPAYLTTVSVPYGVLREFEGSVDRMKRTSFLSRERLRSDNSKGANGYI